MSVDLILQWTAVKKGCADALRYYSGDVDVNIRYHY
jgi:hypothetical protein